MNPENFSPITVGEAPPIMMLGDYRITLRHSAYESAVDGAPTDVTWIV